MRRVAAAFAALLGCGGHGDAAGAVVTAAAAVAGAGVNRAVTKDCWGQCLNGLVCDRPSGLCVKRAPCGGRCTDDETCDDTGATERCTRKEGPWATAPGDASDAGDAADASQVTPAGTLPYLGTRAAKACPALCHRAAACKLETFWGDARCVELCTTENWAIFGCLDGAETCEAVGECLDP